MMFNLGSLPEDYKKDTQQKDAEKTDSPKAKAATKAKEDKANTRLARAKDALKETFGAVEQGHYYSFATMSLWSTHNLIAYLLEQTGPCELIACTWSARLEAIQNVVNLKQSRMLTSVEMLIAIRNQFNDDGVLQLAQMQFDSVGMAICHAKVFVLRNASWSISVVGSANFTNNPRIEAATLTTCAKVADFHAEWIRAEIAKASKFRTNAPKHVEE